MLGDQQRDLLRVGRQALMMMCAGACSLRASASASTSRTSTAGSSSRTVIAVSTWSRSSGATARR